MSEEKVYDPEGFGQALKNLAEGEENPYLHLATAKRHMEETAMHPLTFGVLGEMLVKGRYDDSREYYLGNLETALGNLQATVGGLNQVAANNAGAEQANMIDPKRIELPEEKFTGGNLDNWIEGTLLYFWKIGLLSMLTGASNKASAGLARGAGVAATLWLSYLPDDDEINRAHSHWQYAELALNKANTELVSRAQSFEQVWKGPAKDAFDDYVEKFAAELHECETAIRDGASAMTRVQGSLQIFQHLSLLQALTCLVSLAVLELFSWTPPTNRPAVKAAMELLGVLLSYSTVGIMAMIAFFLKDWAVAGYIINGVPFVSEKQPGGKSDGSTGTNGVDFAEVALSKEDLATLVRDAGGNR